jgi:putative adhesin
MRRTVFLLTMTLAAAAPAAAQRPDDDARIAIREAIRSAVRVAPPERAVRAYQGRNQGPEQTERFSRRVRLGRDGRFSVSNIAGDIVVNAGSGDEVSIEAVKRTHGSQSELADVQIVVDERAGRVDVRTEHDRNRMDRRRGDGVSVDFTITVPQSAAVDMHSVSGSLKATGVRGALRAETVSGDVLATDTPRIELAKSVSGDVTLSGVSTDGDLSAGSVSGDVTAKSVKVHALELNSVSGEIAATDVSCDRFNAKSVSGGVDYSGTITRGGSYEINVHSGTVRLTLANPAGFVLNANTFSGSIRSDLAMTIGGDADARDRDRRRGRDMMSNRTMRATYGDGSATLNVRSFSGDIVINKR